jgi:hypothetical protein
MLDSGSGAVSGAGPLSVSGSGPVSGSGSAPGIPRPASGGDSSQRYHRMPTPNPMSVASLAAARDSRPPGDAPQGAGQSTMLGVAPPPLARRSKTTSAPEMAHTPPGTTGSGPMIPVGPPPQRITPPVRSVPELPLPYPPQSQSSLRTVLQIALVLALCGGAAVGGYFIVLAMFGN